MNSFNLLKKQHEDNKALISLLKEEYDFSFHQQLEEEVTNLTKKIKEFESELFLSGKYDDMDCIIEFHPGAGGTEAHDWAGMLYRMYLRYCQRHKYKVDVLDYQESSEGLLASASLLIKGNKAYGKLKSENGVHRLVRISPFDASKSRHTSFASVNVTPNINNTIEINIDEKDLDITTYRSSGAGGQNVNKTESAIRIVHKPTNIVVTCQIERSQIQNRAIAMNMLKSKLILLEEKKKNEQMSKINGTKLEIEWGSQIRSYVFCPYTLVKDHRTNYETPQVDEVMDGDLDNFINSYLQWRYQNEKEKN